jgi:Polysaccharide lyase family 4, domain II
MSGHPADRTAASTPGADLAGSPNGRRPRRHVSALLLFALSALVVLLFGEAPSSAVPGVPCPDPGCTVTIVGEDFASGAALDDFSFIVNLDNSKLPTDPLALITESNSPVVAEGGAIAGGPSHTTVTLPDGRYLVSVRAHDHKMWGAYFTLPDDADTAGNLTVHVQLTEQSEDHPLPLGKIRVFVFEDNAWTNGAPDTEEAGLNGFKVGLEEQTGNAVTVDYNNNPLCGGDCLTAGAGADSGFVEIPDLGPATYFIDVHPPDGPCNSNPDSQWFQTTTIDGGFSLLASTEEGADGTGAPGEQLWEPPNNRTAYWFGFVCEPQDFAAPGTGEVTGTARNWVEWAPYTTGTYNDPVEDPLVALSDAATDQTVYVGRGDGAGNFDIQNVPAGDYNLAVWDEQLSYIMRFKTVTVGAGETVDMNDVGDDGEVGVGVSRWFGWLDGTVYKDLNDNGMYDAGVDTPLANTDVDQRWRDGSIKEGTVTDFSGRYEYPTAEGGALGRWIVGEQGFARFDAFPGASVHDEHTGLVSPSCQVAAPVPGCTANTLGGGLLMNHLLLEGHRMTVDWGKRDYPAGQPGQIVGITFWATTRNEFDARFQAGEDYEPGIPDVTVLLETPGPNGIPNDDDDIVVNKYVTDHWQHPSTEAAPDTQTCNPLLDFNGDDITALFNPDIGDNCLEVPLTGERTKEGAFDGGYAFADYCPGGYDLVADDGTCLGGGDPVSLVAGTYITHVVTSAENSDVGDPNDSRLCNDGTPTADNYKVTPTHGAVPGDGTGCLYRIVREEDVNVDLGNHYTPAVPPPPCTGELHTIDQATLTPRSVYYGSSQMQPLCDKRLVQITNGQNANADFFLMTNFRNQPNGETGGDVWTGDVEEPGRVIGQVFNDIYFETNPQSVWYGEPRPIPNIPVGIYARVDVQQANGGFSITGRETGRDGAGAPVVTYDNNKWRWIKTVTTKADGSYEALLPSTETLNCPIPQGPCPGMYIAIVDDPGFLDGTARMPGDVGYHANANYNPNLLTANTPFDVWPGQTTQLDTPIDPISGTACEDPAGAGAGGEADATDPARPDLLQVFSPAARTLNAGAPPVIAANATGNNRRVGIYSDFIGARGGTGTTAGRVVLTDVRTGVVQTLSGGNIVSWTPGSASTPDTIVINVPTLGSTVSGSAFLPGPKQLSIVTSNANGGVSSVNGITIHVLGTNGGVTYNPPFATVPAPTTGGHQLQTAINNAAAGTILVLSPGTYNENVLLWKPMKLQGLGPGGIIGAHELQGRDPEDPRFNVSGSVVDGRFFPQNATYFDGQANAHPGILPNFANGDPSVVLRGADITVNAATTTAYNISGSTGIFNAARIDALGLSTGHGDGAGGIQLQASVNNMQLTNNVLENNGGVVTGGIGIGQPFVHGSHNWNVRVANSRLIGNGGLTTSGGLGIFYGSNGYEVAANIICSNFSVQYGAGISHIGLSTSGSIHDNKVYYNDSVDSGAGIAIETELPAGGGLGDGSGGVDVDRNLIQSNFSGDDGGGIFLLDTLAAPINVRNNMIVDNGAADMGGAITMDDSMNVRIVNNTVANNVSTGSSENSAIGVPHSAGLASEANDPLLADLLATRMDAVSTTNGSAVVLDASIQATDLGKSVYGNPGVAGNTTTIVAVNPGVSFTMSSAATGPSGPKTFRIDTLRVSADGSLPDFSNPRGLFNNIFWQNDAMTLDQFGPGATLVDQGFIDFEIRGTANNADRFTPRYSDLTNGQILVNGTLTTVPGALPTPPLPQYLGSMANFSAVPGFVQPFVLELTVSGSRLDPQQAAVTITGGDPPVGLTGNYHITTASPAIDRGAGFSNLGAPAPNGQTPTTSPTFVSILAPCSGTAGQSYPADFDRELRPQLRTTRGRTPWDLGADELTGTVIRIPGSVNLQGNANDATFTWNGSGQLQCSDSTETR